jgi:hypothetical protein
MKMKKKKFPLMALAILLAAGGALANSLTTNHREETQYYLGADGKYYPAGVEGVHYECVFGHFSNCTYYFDAATNTYKPSKAGKILWRI